MPTPTKPRIGRPPAAPGERRRGFSFSIPERLIAAVRDARAAGDGPAINDRVVLAVEAALEELGHKPQ